MRNRHTFIFLISLIGFFIAVNYIFFSETVEIRILAPTNVNLNSGWPNDNGNRVIGILSKGSLIKAKPVVVDDHMVYEIKFNSTAGAKKGFVMFEGYCGGSVVEIRIRRKLFGKDERSEVSCAGRNN